MSVKQDIVDKWEAERQHVLGLIEGLSDEQLARQPQAGEWSLKDTLGHLASSDWATLALARRICEEENPRAISPDIVFDVDRWNAGQVRKRQDKSVAEIRAELGQVRQELLDFIASVTDDQWERRGVHALFDDLSLAEVLRIPYWHLRMHRESVEKVAAELKGAP